MTFPSKRVGTAPFTKYLLALEFGTQFLLDILFETFGLKIIFANPRVFQISERPATTLDSNTSSNQWILRESEGTSFPLRIAPKNTALSIHDSKAILTIYVVLEL